MDEPCGFVHRTTIVARSSTGEPVRLFKNREQLIKANLVGIKTSALKKHIAQQHFYDDKPFELETLGNRGPVHRRLGKSVILPQNYFSSYARRYHHFGLIRRRHVPYNYTQQGRLTRPREGIKLYTSHYMQSIPPKVLMRQNIRWLEQSNATQQATGRQENLQDPMNYTIEVPNNKRTSAMSNGYFPQALRHSVHAQLNPILQEQIRSIQTEYLSVSLAPIEIIPTLTSGATKISMHDRFTSMG